MLLCLFPMGFPMVKKNIFECPEGLSIWFSFYFISWTTSTVFYIACPCNAIEGVLPGKWISYFVIRLQKSPEKHIFESDIHGWLRHDYNYHDFTFSKYCHQRPVVLGIIHFIIWRPNTFALLHVKSPQMACPCPFGFNLWSMQVCNKANQKGKFGHRLCHSK